MNLESEEQNKSKNDESCGNPSLQTELEHLATAHAHTTSSQTTNNGPNEALPQIDTPNQPMH